MHDMPSSSFYYCFCHFFSVDGVSIDSYAQHLQSMQKNPDVSFDLIAKHTFDAAVEVLAGRNITCAQLVVLIESFPVKPQKPQAAAAAAAPAASSAGKDGKKGSDDSDDDDDGPTPPPAPGPSNLRKSMPLSKFHSIKGKMGMHKYSAKDLTVPGSYELYSKFSTFKVELIVVLFPQLVDTINMEIVFMKLTPKERAMVFFRLGYLNVWNPLKPEGGFSLNLMRWEERQVAKVLILLSCIEPGQNWLDEAYRPSGDRNEPFVEDWELPLGWYLDVNLPGMGIVNVKYYSGSGTGKQECKPNVHARMALMGLVRPQAYEDDRGKFHRYSVATAHDLNLEFGCSLTFSPEGSQYLASKAPPT